MTPRASPHTHAQESPRGFLLARRRKRGVLAPLVLLLPLILALAGQAPASVPAYGSSLATSTADTVFRPVRVGAGGYVTGISISDDGRTRVIRTDGFGGYRWAGNGWKLNVSATSLPADDVQPGLGGGVLAVDVAPSRSSRVYMAFNHGVYRSNNSAQTWTRVLTGVSTAPNDSFRMLGSRLEVDPRNPNVVYYGSQLDGMYRTINGGGSWSRVSSVPAGVTVDITSADSRGDVSRPTNVLDATKNLAGAGISAIAVDRSSPVQSGRSQVVYAASYGEGVFRSTDGGDSWSSISPQEIGAVGYLRVLDNGDVLVTSHRDPTDLVGPADVWRFDGSGWSLTGPPRQANWRSLAADPTTPGRVALMRPGGSLALSDDNGVTWSEPKRTQTSEDDVPWLAWALNGGTDWMSNGELAFDPVVPGRLWLTEGTGVWFADVSTADTTVRWNSQGRGIEQLMPTGVVAPPGGKPLMTAWDRPIFRSEHVERYPTGYGPVNQFGSAWSIDWSVSDPNYVVASVASHQAPSDPSTSGFSTDGGRTWTPFPTIPQGSTNATTTFGFGAVAVSGPGNVVWVPAYGKRPEYTLDGGQTWTPIELPGVSDYSRIDSKPHFVNRQVIAADKSVPGTFYLYVHETGVFRTTDGGRSWSQISDDLASNPDQYAWNVTLKAVPGRQGELFVTPGRLGGTTSQAFRRSLDGGESWTDVEGLTGVTAFGFGRPLPGTGYPAIYAAGYLDGRYGIYRSTDDAVTWTYLTDYPVGRTPDVVAIDGDKQVAGQFYLAIGGSGWAYGRRVASAS